MFELLTHYQLQVYWWVILSLLGGLLVFMMFVQGGQTLLGRLAGGDELKKSMLINSLGRKWELGFTTLVLFGGAAFAAFPLFYAVSFGGAYAVWMTILFSFIIQAVAYEYRKKPDNFLGARTYETFLLINGIGATFLIGAAVATFFSGSAFIVDEYHLSQWKTPFYGLEALLNPFNWLLGLSILFLSRALGALYFINNLDDGALQSAARASLKKDALIFLAVFVPFLVWLLVRDGFAYDAQTKMVSMVSFHYLYNLVMMPYVAVPILGGVVLVLYGFYLGLFTRSIKGIWSAGAGTVLTVMGTLLLVGLGDTAYYPSTYDLQSSLTIENSSGSHYTLAAMGYASLMVPFVLAYIYYVWKSMDAQKITADEIQNDSHSY